MSDFSLTLVLQIKTSKIINDMAKVQQKSEKISAFGGIFFVLDKFDRILSSVIDSHLFSDWTNISDKFRLVLRMTVTRFPEIDISFSRDLSYFFPRLQMRISGKTGKNLGKN